MPTTTATPDQPPVPKQRVEADPPTVPAAPLPAAPASVWPIRIGEVVFREADCAYTPIGCELAWEYARTEMP